MRLAHLMPLALASLVTALFAAPVVDAADAPAPATSAADAAAATPRGTTFILPAGFTRKVEGNAVLVMPPEADGSRIAIVDAVADTADAAVAEAWKVLGMTPKLLVATDAAPKDGWDARRTYDYDVAQNAKRVVTAVAYRKGASWTAIAVDVDQAIAEKRGSQFGKLTQRFQPAGYSRESFAGRTAHKLDDARLRQVAAFVETMRTEFDVPGVAIGIVQDGKVVMSRGFGVRTHGKPATVDGDTRFMIASNTKALTTLMLAKLVDAGKLDWSARAEDVYPGFKLGDAAAGQAPGLRVHGRAEAGLRMAV